jgi:hypothetical protein
MRRFEPQEIREKYPKGRVRDGASPVLQSFARSREGSWEGKGQISCRLLEKQKQTDQ